MGAGELISAVNPTWPHAYFEGRTHSALRVLPTSKAVLKLGPSDKLKTLSSANIYPSATLTSS